MIQIINFLFYYFLIIFSAIGYGMIVNMKQLKLKKVDFGFLGLTGILILIFISYYSNLFFKHGYLHNSIIILIGFLMFVYSLIKNFNDLKKNFLITLIVFSILFIGLLMYKNHDDFFYYHFQYTLSLINFKKIFGLAHLGHGYRNPSSIFYLNSLFYLPGIKFYLINSGAVLIFGFANIFILRKILRYFKEKKYDFFLFMLSLIFIYINTTFYRIAEHGTDKSSLILILILSIIYLESLNKAKKQTIIFLEKYYEKIIILIALIVSFKSFYLIYFLFIGAWFYQINKFWSIKKVATVVINNKFTYLSILTIVAVLFSIFTSTGCIIYPASFTCFENFEWSVSVQQTDYMKSWYELWSKAGANPNYRVENTELYLQNFNWVSNWFNDYFFTKGSDFLATIFFISAVTIIYIKSGKQKITNKNNIDFKIFYCIVILFALEWFLNHPALRYGGYSLFVLILFIPVSIYLSKFKYNFFELKKKLSVLLVISLIVFSGKNFLRIFKEIKKYEYKPLESPYFYINKNGFYHEDLLYNMRDNFSLNNINNYIILSPKVIKKASKKN
jgi:hypothetical protein